MTTVNDASKAYLNALKQLQNGGEPDKSGGASFGDVLKQSLGNAIEAQHASEKISARGVIGQADMTDVLAAINNAEMALNTVLAVRDRLVQAYESIMRTPV